MATLAEIRAKLKEQESRNRWFRQSARQAATTQFTHFGTCKEGQSSTV